MTIKNCANGEGFKILIAVLKVNLSRIVERTILIEVIRNLYGIDYFVRSDGKIFSTKNIGRGKYHKEITQYLRRDGYPVVTLGPNDHRVQKTVHRIIASTFISNPENLPEVDHIDNNKENNDVTNLRWISSFENKSRIPYESRSKNRIGSKNGNSKLTEEDVIQIRKMYESGNYTVSKLAELYNCGWTTISHIIKHETWKNV